MTATLEGLTVNQIRTKAREDADHVLARTWPVEALPVDPVAIARDLGVRVFSAELGEDRWGMLVGSTTGVDIYLDKDQPETRFRFSCAHEVGHFLDRGEEVKPGEAFVELRSQAGHGNATEIYANEFAGSLLMPEASFRLAVLNGEDRWDLAGRFHVSLDAVGWRLRHLGLQTQG